MDRLRGQRGYTRISKLIILVLAVAAGYFGYTFWPAGVAYYRIKGDTKRLANKVLQRGQGKQNELYVQRYLKVLWERDGLVLTRSKVSLDDSNPDVIEVSVRLELPYEYPFTGEKRLWKTTVDVTAERIRGF